MLSNNPPNGHSHINERMAQAIRQREGQLRQALGQIQQMSLALQSISTLAALYKVHLSKLTKCEGILCVDETGTQAMNKATKLLAAGHMEPVNEILSLRAELEKANALTGSQLNMISQMEEEVRKLNETIKELKS